MLALPGVCQFIFSIQSSGGPETTTMVKKFLQRPRDRTSVIPLTSAFFPRMKAQMRLMTDFLVKRYMVWLLGKYVSVSSSGTQEFTRLWIILRVGARVGFARYRTKDCDWKEPTIRHISAQGKVSGLFGHIDGDNEGIEIYVKEDWERMRQRCTRSGVATVIRCFWLPDRRIGLRCYC